MENIVNYYHVLGVSPSATFNEIKDAYRKKAKEYHPDKKTGNADLFKRVKEAYEVLKKPEKRKMYDDLLFKPQLNHQPKQAAPVRSNPGAAVIHIGRRTKKKMSMSSLTLNAAFVLIGILGNAYLNKRK